MEEEGLSDKVTAGCKTARAGVRRDSLHNSLPSDRRAAVLRCPWRVRTTARRSEQGVVGEGTRRLLKFQLGPAGS